MPLLMIWAIIIETGCLRRCPGGGGIDHRFLILQTGMEERSWAQYSTVDKSVLHRFSILRCRGGALPAVIFMAGEWGAGAKERGEERRGEEKRDEVNKIGRRRYPSKKGSIRQNEM